MSLLLEATSAIVKSAQSLKVSAQEVLEETTETNKAQQARQRDGCNDGVTTRPPENVNQALLKVMDAEQEMAAAAFVATIARQADETLKKAVSSERYETADTS